MPELPYCWNCGSNLPTEAKFCPACGAGVGEGTPGFLTATTRQYVEELILSNQRLQSNERQQQLEREVSGALEDFELLSQLKGFSLMDIWLPESLKAESGPQTLEHALTEEISEDEAARLIGFLHLVRIVQESLPEGDLEDFGTLLDQAEMRMRSDSDR